MTTSAKVSTRAQSASKSKVKRVRKIDSKVVDKSSLERERVFYEYDTRKHTIDCAFNSHAYVISSKDVKRMIEVKEDRKQFYAICNEIKMLSALHCDAQAQKLKECINTQYDSRKKLLKLVIQVSMTDSVEQLKKKKKVSKKLVTA